MDAAGRTPTELEAETQRMVSASLSKIEVALSEWDAAKSKPAGLSRQVESLRRFHALLYEWERESLKGAPGKSSSIRRLRRFSEICREMEASGLI